MPPATKVLQINPDLFSMKKNGGDLSRTLKKEKKQKPVATTNSSTLRKNLLSKIRDFQKKEEQSAKEASRLPTLDEVKEFDGEFNKSLQFLEELANKHKNTVKAKKEKKRENQQIIQNGGLPVVNSQQFEQVQQSQPQQHNRTVKRRDKNQQRPMINMDLPEELKLDTNFYYGGNNQPHINSNANLNEIQISNMIQPSQPVISVAPLPIIQAPIIQNEIIQTAGNNPTQVIQTTPVININTDNQSISQQPMSAPITTSSASISPVAVNFKQPPPYSNLKIGGNKPTYKEWVRTTQKIHHVSQNGNQNVSIQHHEKDPREKHLEQLKEKYSKFNKSSKNKVHKKRLVKVKTKTIKYDLGKKGKTVSVLIKNNTTRKKVNDEFAQLKIKPINEVKDFLRNKNLIKAGTTAPTDVLRTMYEQSILSGDLSNESKDNLIHNFMSK